jgi:HSP20 family protein
MAETTKQLPVKTEKMPAASTGTGWAPFDTRRREIDRLFDDFGPFDWRLPSRRRLLDTSVPAMSDWQVTPAMDLAEKPTEYEITAEIPGVDENDIEVKLVNHTLTIKGEKSEEKEEKKKDYYLSERRYGSFQRSFQVPDGVDANKIDARFAKGVLIIKLPKTVEAQNAEKKIEVKAA